jgi:hypothetical protein
VANGDEPLPERASNDFKTLCITAVLLIGATAMYRLIARPSAMVIAIILAKRGKFEESRVLPEQQARDVTHPALPAYVQQIATSLGLGRLG